VLERVALLEPSPPPFRLVEVCSRRVARPQGPACDIGAFELVPTASTATTITVSAGEVACGQTVTFTAHVTSASGTPKGSVTFKDGSATIGTRTLSGSFAPFSISSLKTATHSISAVYPTGHGFLGSASGDVKVIVGACEGGGGSGLDPNAPTTNHPLFETPTATLAPASTATPSVNENPASGGPVLFALVGSGALLLLLLAGGSFFYIRRRNGGMF
jgi:Bacterial Ig-like domain (group 3)